MRITLPIPVSTQGIVNDCEAQNISCVSLDSREAERGDLFISLKNEKSHIETAKARGAVCASGIAVLHAVARRVLKEINPYVIAVCGSVGKTTAKEYIHAVMNEQFTVCKTYENYNNEIGVAITVLGMSSDTEILVLELGTNHFGEIEALSRLTVPDLCILTCIGTAHIESFGSREGIAAEKLSVMKGAKDGAPLITQSEFAPSSFPKKNQRSICISTKDKNADYFIDEISRRAPYTAFTVNGDKFAIHEIGEHMVVAATLAIAAGKLFSMSDSSISQGLLSYKGGKMRQSIYKISDYTIIEDCYNASLESVRAALYVLRETAQSKRKIAVLGDIEECGSHAEEIHREVGRLSIEYGVNILVLFGKNTVYAKYEAERLKMEDDCLAFIYGYSHEEVYHKLSSLLRSGDTILFKGSRKSECERIIEYLKKEHKK